VPYGAYSIVVTRYSFHCIEQPEITLREMVRVCAASGRVVVADVCASSDVGRAATFNAWSGCVIGRMCERLRRRSECVVWEGGASRRAEGQVFLEFSLRDLVQHSSSGRRTLRTLKKWFARKLA
jgi:hypothetical protein